MIILKKERTSTLGKSIMKTIVYLLTLETRPHEHRWALEVVQLKERVKFKMTQSFPILRSKLQSP